MDQPSPSACLLEMDARRICVIKPSALGDVVQTLPVVDALRARFPGARISWVINHAIAPLLEDYPGLDEIIPFDRRGSWREVHRMLGGLRDARFDLVFDLQGLFRTAIMTFATGAPVRVGLESAREGSLLTCHLLIPETGLSVPAHARCGRIADALGLPDFPLSLRLAISPADAAWAEKQLAPLARPVLAIQAGAQWRTKRWPPERFAAVACKAVRRFEMAVVLLGHGSEQGLAAQVEQTIRSLVPSVRLTNLAGQTTLKQLAAVLKRSTVLLTNDSGPMHLAAGLGTPVVGLFTCTSPVRSGPGGMLHELVSTEVRCAASYRKRCPYRGRRHMACMEELDVERVWSALCRLMQKSVPQTKAA